MGKPLTAISLFSGSGGFDWVQAKPVSISFGRMISIDLPESHINRYFPMLNLFVKIFAKWRSFRKPIY